MDAVKILDSLSQHWDKVVSHLRFVARMPEYRFHMQEVIVFPFVVYILFCQYIKVFSVSSPKHSRSALIRTKLIWPVFSYSEVS